MNPSTAYCIPTYNHKKIIEDILPLMLPIYKECNIDIYILDSSDNDETEEVYNKFSLEADGHLFYKRFDSSLKADAKYVAGLKGEFFTKEYEYLWISKDRAFFDEETVKYIIDIENKNPDIIYLPVENDWSRLVQRKTGKVCESKTEFFRDFGAVTTSWETIIFNYKKLLKDMPWDYYEEKTMFGREFPFNQTFAVFEVLKNIEKCNIYVAERNRIRRSYHKDGESTWQDRAVDIWAFTWPEFIDSLPECYNEYKASVKLDGVSIPWMWASCDYIYSYYKDGIFTRDKWKIIKDKWKEISILPIEWIELILDEKMQELAKKVYGLFQESITKGNIEMAYMIYNSLSSLSGAIEKEQAETIDNLFNIYKLEHEAAAGEIKAEESFFETGCTSLQDYKDKQDLVTMLINSLKDGNNADLTEQLMIMKKRLRISDLAVKYYINRLQE